MRVAKLIVIPDNVDFSVDLNAENWRARLRAVVLSF